MNCSKETTVAEVNKIMGVPEHVQRAAGLNLTAGTINAVEICCSVLEAPTFHMLCEQFEKENIIVHVDHAA